MYNMQVSNIIRAFLLATMSLLIATAILGVLTR